MQVRVSDFIASHLEAIQQKLEYENISAVANLVLDSIKYQWSLNLQYVPQLGTNVLKLRLASRHRDWLTQYGAFRGISPTGATNFILSEYFRGISTTSMPIPPQAEPESKTEPELQINKPRGTQLLKSLKL